jgi:HAD superfamily hydrolase (TIGR01490 family)
MKQRYLQGEIGPWQLASGLAAYLQYKLGVLDVLSWTQALMQEFRGRSEAELLESARDLFRRSIRPLVYPEAEAIVRMHQQRGDVVCIVSGATRFVVEPLAEYLGVEHMVHTHLEVEAGRMTGRVVEPICFEDGKIHWLSQFIDAQRIDLAKSWFYTDSVTDLPLLDLVGHPVVVNPDPRLYRTAVRRCWPVRLFDPPPAS